MRPLLWTVLCLTANINQALANAFYQMIKMLLRFYLVAQNIWLIKSPKEEHQPLFQFWSLFVICDFLKVFFFFALSRHLALGLEMMQSIFHDNANINLLHSAVSPAVCVCSHSVKVPPSLQSIKGQRIKISHFRRDFAEIKICIQYSDTQSMRGIQGWKTTCSLFSPNQLCFSFSVFLPLYKVGFPFPNTTGQF